MPQAIKMPTCDSLSGREMNHKTQRNQLTISVTDYILPSLQLFGSPIKEMNEVSPPTGVSRMTSYNILAYFYRPKTVKTISCLTRETSLKSYFPLLLPMPEITLLGLGQETSLHLLLTSYSLVAIVLPLLLHCHNTLAA